MDRVTIARLLAKLNRLTSEGVIRWESKKPPESLVYKTDKYIPVYFETIYDGRSMAVFQERVKDYSGEIDEFYYAERHVFVILDENDMPLWRYTDHEGVLYDLFNTVSEKVSGIDDIINKLLND